MHFVDDKIYVTRVFSVLSIFSSAGSIIVAVCTIKFGKPIKLAGLPMFLSCCFGFIAVIVYTVEVENEKERSIYSKRNYYWAYKLCWVGTIGSFVLSCYALFIDWNEKRKNEHSRLATLLTFQSEHLRLATLLTFQSEFSKA